LSSEQKVREERSLMQRILRERLSALSKRNLMERTETEMNLKKRRTMMIQ
jgi:hypothetical protein